MPDADAHGEGGGLMGHTGRHWSRCKLKIGSNVHLKQICFVWDWRETRRWGLQRRMCKVQALLLLKRQDKKVRLSKVKTVSLTVCSLFEEKQLTKYYVGRVYNIKLSPFPLSNITKKIKKENVRGYSSHYAFHDAVWDWSDPKDSLMENLKPTFFTDVQSEFLQHLTEP